MQHWCQVCVGYVRQSCYVETIRIVQRPNDPKRKSNGGTTETARQKILRSEKESAAGRASSSPGGGPSKFEARSRQIRRNQETPTRASPQRVVYPSIIQRKKIGSWCRYCRLHRNQVKVRWSSAAEQVQNQRPQSKLPQPFFGFLFGFSTRPASADYEGGPPVYSSLRSRITFLEGKPHSGALTNYRTRERIFGFNPILRIQCLGYAR